MLFLFAYKLDNAVHLDYFIYFTRDSNMSYSLVSVSVSSSAPSQPSHPPNTFIRPTKRIHQGYERDQCEEVRQKVLEQHLKNAELKHEILLMKKQLLMKKFKKTDSKACQYD